MKFSKVDNPIHDFDFELLDDPDFKEDSVREEIIIHLLSALGYKASAPNKIIRSKSLLHPYVSIGSRRKKINIIPDYLLEVNGKFAWVLEAKAPSEKIIESKYVEQAYSYAIHSEVRVPYFALCNGREFVLYSISAPKPIIHIPIQELGHAWNDLHKYLAPQNIDKQEFKLAKDFGLHIKRLGLGDIQKHIFPNVPVSFLGQIESDKYRFSASIELDKENIYLASFDFNSQKLNQLIDKLPKKAIEILGEPFNGQVKKIVFGDGVFHLTVDCRLGEVLEENHNEIFLPLVVNNFL